MLIEGGPINRIILIDDDANKGWAAVFELIVKKCFPDNLASFHYLDPDAANGSGELFAQAARASLETNTNAYFILDNRFFGVLNCGLALLREFGQRRAICMHTLDHVIAFEAAKLGAKFFLKKDIPEHQMSHEEFSGQATQLIRSIAFHFGLAPELAWLLFMD